MVTIRRNGQEEQVVARHDTEVVEAPRRTSNGRLPFEVSSPDDTHYVNMLVYGDTGVGKTHLLGTALECEEMQPMLLIDIDGGSLTLKGLPVKIARPKSWREVQEIYQYLFFDNKTFRAVGIDTLTETQRRHSMGTILGEVDQMKGGYYKNLENTPVANRQDWLRSSGQMTKVIQAFRGLAYLDDPDRRLHVIFTAHEKLDERRKVVAPELPGALGVQCGRWVDILARMSTHGIEDEDGNIEERRHLLVAPYTDADGLRYLAKNRGGRLGRAMWDPDMTKIAAAWRSEDAVAA